MEETLQLLCDCMIMDTRITDDNGTIEIDYCPQEGGIHTMKIEAETEPAHHPLNIITNESV